MNSIPIGEIAKAAPDSELILQSLEGSIYLALVKHGETKVPIALTEGSFLTFRNITEAMKELASLGWQAIWLEHETAYDEMIGHETSIAGPMLVKLGHQIAV